MKQLFYYIAISTFIFGMFFSVLLAFWLVYPYKTIEVNGNGIVTTQEQYKGGDTLFYALDYCKYTDAEVHIGRSFIDTVIYSMPDITAKNPTGCRLQVISAAIPNLPTGTYYLRLTYTYKVNPVRSMTTTIYSNKFEIVEK